MAKRDRSINWEKEEKALLREIIRPFMHIIENKDISTNTNKAKINAWTEITEQFNRANKRIRDKKQLVNQWKVTKLNSKKELSLYRQRTTQTGGGPKPPSPSPETLEILELLPQEFEIDTSEFDCDGAKNITNEINKKLLTKCNNVNYITILIDDNKMVESTSHQTPFTSGPIIISEAIKVDIQPTASTSQPTASTSQLTASTSQPVLSIQDPTPIQQTPKCSAKKRMLSDKFNFAEASFEDMHKLRVLESERQQKEHDLRMKCMAEIHSQIMVNLKLQEEMFRKFLEK